MRAASCGATIEQTAKELKNVPSSNTIRYHLKKINDFKQLEAEINLALKSQIPKGLKKKKQTLALDLKQMLSFLRQAVDQILGSGKRCLYSHQ